MDELISHFTLLSGQALNDKSFDPAAIEDLMKLFEIEAYNSWAAMEFEQVKETGEAEREMWQAEEYLESVLDGAMDEYLRLDEEMESMAREELLSLEEAAERAWRKGKLMVKVASFASKRYVDTALNAATKSMKSTLKGISSNKVHPS